MEGDRKENMFLQTREWDSTVERLHKEMQSNYKHYLLSDTVKQEKISYAINQSLINKKKTPNIQVK